MTHYRLANLFFSFFLRPVNTRDFWCNFCRARLCNFCRKCLLAAIALLFFAIRERCLLQFPKNRHQVASTAISRRQVAQKSPLVYTCDFHRELKRDKNCTKNRTCKPILKARFEDILPAFQWWKTGENCCFFSCLASKKCSHNNLEVSIYRWTAKQSLFCGVLLICEFRCVTREHLTSPVKSGAPKGSFWQA